MKLIFYTSNLLLVCSQILNSEYADGDMYSDYAAFSTRAVCPPDLDPNDVNPANFPTNAKYTNCPFPDLESSQYFTKISTDCRNNPIDESTSGEWYASSDGFDHKPNAAFHMSPNPMNKEDALNYCNSLGMDAVGLWCPNSDKENTYIWYHHPAQPLHKTDRNQGTSSAGFLTGIFRKNNFENDYYCAFNDVNDSSDMYKALYPLGDRYFFTWDTGAPDYVYDYDSADERFYANDVYVKKKNTRWNDFAWTKGFKDFGVVCEMNCDDFLDATPLQFVNDTHYYVEPPIEDCWAFSRKKRSVEEEIFFPDFVNDNAPIDRSGIDPIWGTCDFPGDPEPESPEWEQVNVDCYGNPLDANQHGTWWKPAVPFPGKEKVAYHFLDDYYPKSFTWEQCAQKNLDFVHLWCPASYVENNWIWAYHYAQPINTVCPWCIGIWTGIYRTQNNGDEYYCAVDVNITESVDDHIHKPLYQQHYFHWDPISPGYPQFTNDDDEFANDIYVTWDFQVWRDIKHDHVMEMAAGVCEMDCSFLQEDNCEIRAAKDQIPLDQILECSDTPTDDLLKHGCHCVKLGGHTAALKNIGGLLSLDYTDGLCKDWHGARRCIGLEGRECFERDLTNQVYDISFANGLFNCVDSNDACLDALCIIDVHYAQLMYDEMVTNDNFSPIFADSNDCPFCDNCHNGSGGVICIGNVPDVSIVPDV